MLVKAIIILFLLIILYSLGSALFYLVRDRKADQTRVVTALTWRISLSMVLFLLLMLAFAMGWIKPHNI
jgi:putative copper export protein